MKFAQEFKRALQEGGYPQHWVDSAIPYGQLKKCLKNVIRELEDIGLGRDTLAQLASRQDPSELGFYYNLDGEACRPKHLRPRLTFFVHVQDGVVIDATLSPATRDFLEKVAAQAPESPRSELSPPSSPTVPLETDAAPSDSPDDAPRPRPRPGAEAEAGAPAEAPAAQGKASADAPGRPCSHAAACDSCPVQQVEVPLVFDAQFFDILQDDVLLLDSLQEAEQAKLRAQISQLGLALTQTTKPSNGRRARDDLARWRDIFELYLEARVFFSTRESDHGARTSAQALQQLRWFQEEVLRRKLVQGLKLTVSREAFANFVNMNALLLLNLSFQELNQRAVAKILKKFDKRTSLGVAKTFPVVVRSDRLLAGSIAKELCAQVSSEIIAVVPQLDDFLCPICFAVAFWPIRLNCNHVFCSRCLVKMQRKCERFCPLCRSDVIMQAGYDNYDKKLASFLREYFPKDVREKLKANNLERGKEIYGPDYTDRPCCVM